MNGDTRMGRANGASDPRQAPAGGMSRAERFEDEKKRLMDSCFSKVDINGQLAESYITHLRVEEDQQYPTAPPPPSSPFENKKPRIIIIAVRSSGRVRMHKARENSNGSFSIGKTWNLEDLSAIRSFSADIATRNAEERLRMQVASSVGFIVTIAKPYYWQAGSAREKDFFIASLVKIYRKYTQGRIPDLQGFPDDILEQLTAVPVSQTPMNPPPINPALLNRTSAPQGPQKELSPPTQPPPIPDNSSRKSLPNDARPSSRGTSNSRPPSRPQDGIRTSPSPDPALPPFGSRGSPAPSDSSRLAKRPPDSLLGPGSQEDLRPKSPGSTRTIPSRDPSARPSNAPPGGRPSFSSSLRPKVSQSDMNGRPLPSPTSSTFTTSTAKEPLRERTPSPSSRPPTGKEGRDDLRREAIGSRANGRPPSPSSNRRPSEDRSSPAPPKSLPDEPPARRRPPMLTAGASTVSQRSEASSFVTPRSTPGSIAPNEPPPFEQEFKRATDKVASPQRGVQTSTTDATQPSKNESLPVDEPENAQATSADVTSPIVSPNTDTSSIKSPSEEYRPGLGPMIKSKNNTASKMRRAATAYNAFKPRAGGAADRARAAMKSPDGPDGITAVVPAPPKAKPEEKAAVEKANGVPPQVDVPKPTTPNLTVTGASPDQSAPPGSGFDKALPSPGSGGDPRSIDQTLAAREERKRKRRSMQEVKYISNLDIAPSLVEDRGLEFETALTDFGWQPGKSAAKDLALMEIDVRRELTKLESGTWLKQMDHRDQRLEVVERLLDRTIAECDELEGLLTLYGVELSSLNDDIAFIEAQSQGLQVQTANQRLLQAELSGLLDTISIDSKDLDALRRAPLEIVDGQEAAERSLMLLYKALVTMDPVISEASGRTPNGMSDSLTNGSSLSGMRALKEKRQFYDREAASFLNRLRSSLMEAISNAAALAPRSVGRSASKGLLGHETIRQQIWRFGPLLLFAKMVDQESWKALMQAYVQQTSPDFASYFKEALNGWKQSARPPSKDDSSEWFAASEKEAEHLSTAARKLTVKRSGTIARQFRAASGEKAGSQDRLVRGGLQPSEAFANMMEEAVPMISSEQNFIVDFFHASSSENIDFIDAVQSLSPADRYGSDLRDRKPFERDRMIANEIRRAMEGMMKTWADEVEKLAEWAAKDEPMQAIGILGAIERHMLYLEDSNQDYLNGMLHRIHEKISRLFTTFITNQVRAIEETKVKIKKRNGLVAFVKTFPTFVTAAENTLAAVGENDALDVRRALDDAYQRINKAIFESLQVIAKEGFNRMNNAPVASAGPDAEDKETLNYLIFLIENYNHYIAELDDHGDLVLKNWKGKAELEMEERVGQYVDAVVQRPMGKIISFLNSTQQLLASEAPSSISARPTHSPTVFRKLLSAHDAKETRKGTDHLKKRVEKHFGDADEAAVSRKLVGRVLGECQARYADIASKIADARQTIYEGKLQEGDRLDWGEREVQAFFV